MVRREGLEPPTAVRRWSPERSAAFVLDSASFHRQRNRLRVSGVFTVNPG
jgi:hypothetical protein